VKVCVTVLWVRNGAGASFKRVLRVLGQYYLNGIGESFAVLVIITIPG
jgi:hypothetical protein